MSKSASTDRLDYLLTFYIGLGFFTTGITWSLYNSYVPIFLREYVFGSWQNLIIGIIMVLDNIAAITLQPWIGAKSDHTWTRFGRRMPYILLGVPIAAFFFGLIPLANSLLVLLTVITIFNIAMAIYRAPVVALMPDIIPSKFRSKANGVINLMGGIGAIYAFFVGSYLYEYSPPLAFWSTSLIMILALLVLFWKVKEPEKPELHDTEEKIGIVDAFREVISNPDRSGILILLAIFTWFLGYNIIETWYTTYGVVVLGIPDYIASRTLTTFALSFVIFAIPAGFVATKIGRKNTIVIGLVGLIISLASMIFITNITLIYIILGIAGLFWAFININSITIVWEIATGKKLGAYTGLYYFFSALAAIVGPVFSGFIFDIVGLSIMFWLSTGLMVIALLFTLGVKSGEVSEEEIEAAPIELA